jgi:hypothetical protein
VPPVTKVPRDQKELPERTDLMVMLVPQAWLEVKETMVQLAQLVFPDQKEKMVESQKLMALLDHVVLLDHKVNPDMLVNKDIQAKMNLVDLALLETMVPQDPKELPVNLDHLVWLELKENKVVAITVPHQEPHQVIKWLLEGSFHFECLSFPSVFVFIFFVQPLGKQKNSLN